MPVTQAGPSAFENIGENYYYVFVALSLVWATGIYFFYPSVLISQHGSRLLTNDRETKNKTLEEIAAAFGDRLVDVDQQEIHDNISEKKPVDRSQHVETEP